MKSKEFSDYDPEKDIPITEEEKIVYDDRNTEILLETGTISMTEYNEIQIRLEQRRDELRRMREKTK